MLTGYLAASVGKVTIDGRDIQRESEESQRTIFYETATESYTLYVGDKNTVTLESLTDESAETESSAAAD